MPTLRIGTRIFEAETPRVIAEAELMFKLSPRRRHHRLDGAKTQLSRAIAAGQDPTHPTVRRATATILSQRITEI